MCVFWIYITLLFVSSLFLRNQLSTVCLPLLKCWWVNHMYCPSRLPAGPVSWTLIKLVWAAAAVHSVDIWGPQSFLLCGFFCSAQLQIIKPWLTFSASLSQRLPVLSHAAFHFRWEPVSLKCLMAAHWRLTVLHHGFIQTPKVKLHALNTVQNWHVFLKPVLHFISLFPSRSVSDLWDRGWHLYAESKWATWSYNGAGTSS